MAESTTLDPDVGPAYGTGPSMETAYVIPPMRGPSAECLREARILEAVVLLDYVRSSHPFWWQHCYARRGEY